MTVAGLNRRPDRERSRQVGAEPIVSALVPAELRQAEFANDVNAGEVEQMDHSAGKALREPQDFATEGVAIGVLAVFERPGQVEEIGASLLQSIGETFAVGVAIGEPTETPTVTEDSEVGDVKAGEVACAVSVSAGVAVETVRREELLPRFRRR